MGPRVNLLAENHNFDLADVPIKSQGVTRQFTIAKDTCWLGVDGPVLAGVAVGHDRAVGMDAVVTSSIRPYSPVGGVLARVSRMSSLGEAIPSGADGPAIPAPLS